MAQFKIKIQKLQTVVFHDIPGNPTFTHNMLPARGQILLQRVQIYQGRP